MSRHRILPITRQQRHHPLHRSDYLGLLLFLSLFAIFSILILSSRLSPAKLTGQAANASTRVNITSAWFFDCDVTLPAGTSLVSFPCIPLELPVDEFLTNLSAGGSRVGAIYRYAPWRTGKWEAYNGSLPNWTVQSLSTLGNPYGYAVVMAGSERFFYRGFLPSSSDLLLRRGWNLAGYPSNVTRPLNESLASINDTYLLIRTLIGTEESGTYLDDTPPPGGESLTNTSIYRAYWLNMSSQDIWVVTT